MRILIAEDVATSACLMKELLRPYGEVQVATSGDVAVQLFKDAQQAQQPFDLIFLDIMMPHVDGQQALRELRAFEEGRGIFGRDGAKVIFVTSLNDPKNVMTAFKGGCEAFLAKPVNPSSLRAAIAELGITPTTSK